MISEPRLIPALAQFTSGGMREPGDETSHSTVEELGKMPFN